MFSTAAPPALLFEHTSCTQLNREPFQPGSDLSFFSPVRLSYPLHKRAKNAFLSKIGVGFWEGSSLFRLPLSVNRRSALLLPVFVCLSILACSTCPRFQKIPSSHWTLFRSSVHLPALFLWNCEEALSWGRCFCFVFFFKTGIPLIK